MLTASRSGYRRIVDGNVMFNVKKTIHPDLFAARRLLLEACVSLLTTSVHAEIGTSTLSARLAAWNFKRKKMRVSERGNMTRSSGASSSLADQAFPYICTNDVEIFVER